MDLKSYDRWDDYTRVRDEMFRATDTEWAPWYVARSGRQEARPTERHQSHPGAGTVQEAGRRPGRAAQAQGRGYQAADHPFKYIPEAY